MKQLQPINANSANTILVVVDVQNEFAKVGGKGGPGRGPVDEERANAMAERIAAIKRLVERAREVGVRIVYIQSVRTHQEAEFTVFKYPLILKLGSWGAEIVDELKPREGDIVVQKYCHDPFFNTNLDKVLNEMVSEATRYQVIVTGGGINVCAYHAVMGFYLRNYWTIVPVDAVYGNEQGTKFALEQFSLGVYPNIFLSMEGLIRFTRQVPAEPINLVPNT